MNTILNITSSQNPRIKWLVKLREKANFRREEALFFVEGVRETLLAVRNRFEIQEIYVCEDLINADTRKELEGLIPKVPRIDVSLPVYQKIAVRGTTEGIIGVAVPRNHFLQNLHLPENPLILVVEKVEKPGNLGALFRTADAAGLDAVIICDPTVDLYNPNVIRSSLGCLFTLQIASCNSDEAVSWLKEKSVKTFAATPEGAETYHKVNYTGASAIVVGSEANGLTDIWLNQCDARIVIPMKGEHDSLNVSVSAAIVIFEAVRQRS